MKLQEDLYFYPWESMVENNCNSYLIAGKVPVLVDPGHHHLFPRLREAMAADGFKPEDIGLVVVTHPHPDHMEAVEDFLSGEARIGLHPEADRFIKDTGAQLFRAMGLELPAYRVDLYLEEGDLEVGDHQFRVFSCPGHAPGSICLYWPERRALFTGDVIFTQSVGRTDLPGGNTAQLQESITRLAELEVELLLPGHGPPLQGRGEVKQNFYLVKNLFYGAL